jgi:O-antigen/teichoic acid export membrane protein
VGTPLIAEPIIFAFAGRDYLPESAWALQLLIWYLPFSFVNGLTQYVLIAVNRQRTITICFFVAAIGNLLLNLLLIPRYGFLGASFVTVVSELILLAPFWHVVAKELPPVPLLGLAWRPALATAVMAGAVYWVRAFNPWLAIPVGALVYLAALLALGGVSPDEILALRRRRA